MNLDGEVIWTRRFGRPVDFPPGERLVLRIDSALRPLARVVLNGTEVPLADGGMGVAHDVTAILGVGNRLTLHVATAGGADHSRRSESHQPLPDTVARVWLEVHGAVDPGHP